MTQERREYQQILPRPPETSDLDVRVRQLALFTAAQVGLRLSGYFFDQRGYGANETSRRANLLQQDSEYRELRFLYDEPDTPTEMRVETYDKLVTRVRQVMTAPKPEDVIHPQNPPAPI